MNTKRKMKIDILDIVPLITLVVIFAGFAIASGGKTASAYNMGNLIQQVFPIAIGALGVIFVVSLGSTDISVGASGAFCATLAGILTAGTNPWLLIPVTLVLSSAVGAVIGFVVTRFKIDSFMTTLAFLISMKGLLVLSNEKELVQANPALKPVTTMQFSVIILVILTIVVYYVFEKSHFGYYCKCVGENERTVRSVGINVDRMRIICFVISGFMAGVFGFMQFCKNGGSSATLCTMFEMRIQMAIFLGGVLVTGGFSAKLYKVLLGSLTITIIENGLTVCRVPSAISEASEGIMLILILFITVTFNRKAQQRNAEEAAVEEAAEAKA